MEACKAGSTRAIYKGIDRRLEAKTGTKQTQAECVCVREIKRFVTPHPTVFPFIVLPSFCSQLVCFALITPPSVLDAVGLPGCLEKAVCLFIISL